MSISLPQGYESIDFGELAEHFPPLKPFLIRSGDGRPTLNFKDDAANRTLTQALLKRDFGLDVTLLEDRLCPPIPNRLNYVLWITQLVKIMGLNDTVVGLDIGTGSTAIYPLLSCSLHESWRFLATDIDAKSLGAAAANIERNNVLKGRIQLLPSTQDAPILFPLLPETLTTLGLGPETRLPAVAFSMCNPPFYSDADDVLRSADNKNANPHAVCTGALVEMITPGGEVAFVRRMLDESFMLQDTCGWYTSLLGKMGSLIVLVDAIKEKGINNYAITELVQGSTRRWVIAWSYLDIRLPDTLARPKSQSLRPIAPPPNTLRHPIRQPTGSQPLSYNTLLRFLAEVPLLYFEELQDPQRVIATAHEVTWTRAARRRLARGPTKDAVINSESRPVVVSEIVIVDQAILEVRWVRGRDRGVFESFWGYLSGKLS